MTVLWFWNDAMLCLWWLILRTYPLILNLHITQISALIKTSERNSWKGVHTDSDLLWQNDQKSFVFKEVSDLLQHGQLRLLATKLSRNVCKWAVMRCNLSLSANAKHLCTCVEYVFGLKNKLDGTWGIWFPEDQTSSNDPGKMYPHRCQQQQSLGKSPLSSIRWVHQLSRALLIAWFRMLLSHKSIGRVPLGPSQSLVWTARLVY